MEKKELKKVVKKIDKKEEPKEKKSVIKIILKKIKKGIKAIINYIATHKLLSIITAIFLILAIIAFFIKILLGLVVIILWLVTVIIIKVIGGKKMVKKKKDSEGKKTIEEKKKKDEVIKDKSKDETKKIEPIDPEALKEKKKKKKKLRRKLFKLLLNGTLLMILLGLIVGIIFSIYIVINAPDFNPENLYRAESSVIYDKNGNQIAKIGKEKRKKVEYNDLPQVLVDAIIATEDSRFFQHNGFDLPRFAKASFGQVINKITGHGNAGGGSTLSMQVVKNNFTTVDQTIKRKFTDIYIAIFKLEKNYSKEEIIEYYVNAPFLGNNSYGVEMACQNYFGKSVSDINLAEAAIIAGLFQAPSSYDPYMHPEATEERRETVLYLMRMHGYITKEEEELAKSIPVTSLLNSTNEEANTNEFQPFIDIVLDEVEEKTGLSPYTTGMKIYTTLDTDKQRILNDVMDGKSFEWKDDLIQAGVGVIDVDNGAILAVGAGRNRVGERQYNYATMIEKQIGSTAKPIFDYGPAIEYNNFCLTTPFYDAPYTYSGGGRLYNVDFGYRGVLTLKEALAQSRNIPALKAFQSVENSKIVEFSTSLGMTPEIDSTGYIHEAHALGAFTGTNPVQLAGAYAAFANGGYFSEPYTVDRIEYIDTGKTVSLKSKKKKVMSDATAYMITDTLLYAVEGVSNIGGTVDGVRLAAKTGTTNLDNDICAEYGIPRNSYNDIWIAGYTPEISVALWYGYDKLEYGYYNDNSDNNRRNRLYRQIIKDLANTDPNRNNTFSMPSSVVSVTVERETYPVQLPGDNTPGEMKVTGYCKAGTEPSTKSKRYDKLANVTNIKSKVTDETVILTWNPVAETSYNSLEEFKKRNEVFYAQHIEDRYNAFKDGLGEYGYQILEYNKETKESKELEWVGSSNSYSFTRPEYDATYTVITRYKKDNVTASTGSSVDVTGVKPKYTADDFTASNGLTITSLTYKDTPVQLSNLTTNISIKDKKDKDVTSKCSISVNNNCTKTSGTGSCSVSNNIATFSGPGTYTVHFKATCEGFSIEVPSTSVTVNQEESSEDSTNP